MKKSKLPRPIVIVILSLITIVIWTTFEIYRSLTFTPLDDIPTQVTVPLNPELNLDALSSLSQKIHLTDSQIGALPVTQTTIPPLAETASPSATIQPAIENQATNSAIPDE